MNNSGNFGLSLFGDDPFGSGVATFGVAGASVYSPTLVQVRFTDVIDLTDLAFTDPTNYVLTPPLLVSSVIVESADSVILETATLGLILYTVTVLSGQSYFGIPMVPPNNTATFTGIPFFPGYFSVGTTPTRVRCLFSTEMMVNAALTDPTQYTVADLNGNSIPVVSAQLEQLPPLPALSVVLTLSAPMQTTQWYQTTLGAGIVDLNDHPLDPNTFDFQWVLPVQNVTVPISEFSGEVSGGFFGDPDGLVFFSPSLNVAAANSVIQIEEVSVCTMAYDQYTFPPQTPDPSPFYVWNSIGPQTTLGEQGIVLFGGFPSMGEVQFEFGFGPPVTQDQMPPAFDGSCSITIKAGFAPGFVALLNNPAYWLFDGILADTTTPPMFICADNGAPIPPGSETIIVLHLAMVGNATMVVQEPSVVHWAMAHITADSNLVTGQESAPLAINANSWMRVARPHVNIGASVTMNGAATLNIMQAQNFGDVTAAIQGYAIVDARVEQDWQVSATIEGNATIFTRPSLNQMLASTISGDSSLTGFATKGPIANAAIVAGSSATAQATINHFASASLSGHAFVTASPT